MMSENNEEKRVVDINAGAKVWWRAYPRANISNAPAKSGKTTLIELAQEFPTEAVLDYVVATKADLPLWSFLKVDPATHQRRGGEGDVVPTVILIDVDDHSTFDIAADPTGDLFWNDMVSFVKTLDVQAWCYTSASHMLEKSGHAACPRFRIVIPLRKHTDNPGQWVRAVKSLTSRMPAEWGVDPKSHVSGQSWYMPGLTEDSRKDLFRQTFIDGLPFDALTASTNFYKTTSSKAAVDPVQWATDSVLFKRAITALTNSGYGNGRFVSDVPSRMSETKRVDKALFSRPGKDSGISIEVFSDGAAVVYSANDPLYDQSSPSKRTGHHIIRLLALIAHLEFEGDQHKATQSLRTEGLELPDTALPKEVLDLCLVKDGALADCQQNMAVLIGEGEHKNALTVNVMGDAQGWAVVKPVRWAPHLPVPRNLRMDEVNRYMVPWLRKFGVTCKSATVISETVNAACLQNFSDTGIGYDPSVEWLQAQKWDGTPRLGTLLIDAFGAKDTAHVRNCTTWWFMLAARRILDPGMQADYVLTLLGPQGVRKSSFVASLLPHGWAGIVNLSGTNSKDDALNMHRHVLIEWAEMSGHARRDDEHIKTLITTRADTLRPPYGRVTVTLKRKFSIIATTNKLSLRDSTGARRFWVVECPKPMNQERLEWIKENRGQLWAEARDRVAAGERCWPEHEHEHSTLSDITDQYQEHDMDVEQALCRLDDLLANLGVKPGLKSLTDIMEAIGAGVADTNPTVRGRISQAIASDLRERGWTMKRVGTRKTRMWLPPSADEAIKETVGDM